MKNQPHCPTCHKPDTWHKDNHYRPFCSERCKLIDFGEWAAEMHRVAGEEAKNEEAAIDNENAEPEGEG